MKRLLDISIALVLLPPAAAVILACWAAIRLTSPGPAIFRQVRVGRDEKPFVCLKLRTMYVDTGHAPSHEVSASAVTPVGRSLRALKLDELPQLWNVLKGEMSLVGPRPCLPTQTELIAARRRRGLYTIRPGVTGIAQVAGIDMSDPEKLAAKDAEYLQRMSLRTDMQLLVATLLGSGRGDRVKA